jgi:NADPH:quinone reductase-like Zn-dependent oxidoreductase
MTHAIRIHETGGPEKMLWEEVEVGAPGEGEVRLRHTAVGLNFIDVYHRTGLYPLPQMSTTAPVSTRCPSCRMCSAWRVAASSRRLATA